MTYLELIAEVGAIPMEIARMYLAGMMTGQELTNVIGFRKAETVKQYQSAHRKESDSREFPPAACRLSDVIP